MLLPAAVQARRQCVAAAAARLLRPLLQLLLQLVLLHLLSRLLRLLRPGLLCLLQRHCLSAVLQRQRCRLHLQGSRGE